jgi:hypothetical protein
MFHVKQCVARDSERCRPRRSRRGSKRWEAYRPPSTGPVHPCHSGLLLGIPAGRQGRDRSRPVPRGTSSGPLPRRIRTTSWTRDHPNKGRCHQGRAHIPCRFDKVRGRSMARPSSGAMPRRGHRYRSHRQAAERRPWWLVYTPAKVTWSARGDSSTVTVAVETQSYRHTR